MFGAWLLARRRQHVLVLGHMHSMVPVGKTTPRLVCTTTKTPMKAQDDHLSVINAHFYSASDYGLSILVCSIHTVQEQHNQCPTGSPKPFLSKSPYLCPVMQCLPCHAMPCDIMSLRQMLSCNSRQVCSIPSFNFLSQPQCLRPSPSPYQNIASQSPQCSNCDSSCGLPPNCVPAHDTG